MHSCTTGWRLCPLPAPSATAQHGSQSSANTQRRAAAMRIAWIGLGNMGAPMSGRLVEAGHEVTGFDLSPAAREAAEQAGVRTTASAAEAVEQAELVFLMLPNGTLVRQVLEDGVLDASPADAIFVDSSTTDIEDAVTNHTLVTGTGRRFVDAPVSGGISGAAAGTLTFMLGCTEDESADFVEVIEVLAGRIFHLGRPGLGQAAKIVNNMMLGISLAGTCEGAVLAERLGLDSSQFQQLASVSSGDSWALRTWYPVAGVVETAAVNRDFAGGFSVDLIKKDLGLALNAGRSTNTPLPHAESVAASMEALSQAGHGQLDCSVLVRTIDQTLPTAQTDGREGMGQS
ncbi:NAD(P)-dependent oxidoreductase [Luteococcus sp. OSA5]|uniref:NAD(P)-dependent oxidoreductase n=1 Tax=Luteococcus sp. OSA5 TaxID=3401630 RepID=UPI003B4289D8